MNNSLPVDSFRKEKRAYFAEKRIFDYVLSVLILVFLIPLFAVIAILIKIDSKGPVLFKQERVGKGGKLFEIYKFRSLMSESPQYALAPLDKADPRITSVGRLIRKFGIDELPQFFNVIKGDMSLVGPRPEMPFLVAQFHHLHKVRLEALPGITGLWQISLGRSSYIHENVEYDHRYIENASFLLDLQIMIRTISFLLKKKKAC